MQESLNYTKALKMNLYVFLQAWAVKAFVTSYLVKVKLMKQYEEKLSINEIDIVKRKK